MTPADELPPRADRTPFRLPERYACSRAYMLLRAAERYGQHPALFARSLSPAESAVIAGQEMVRQAEERRAHEEMLAALAAGTLRRSV